MANEARKPKTLVSKDDVDDIVQARPVERKALQNDQVMDWPDGKSMGKGEALLS